MNKNSTFFKYHFYKFQIQIFVDFIPCIFLSQIIICLSMLFSSIQFRRSVMSDSLQPHESKHARPPCPSPTPRVHLNSCPLSRWCHPAISSSVVPFSSSPNPSQHQSLFHWVSSSHKVAKVLEFQPQHHSLQRNPRADLLQNGLMNETSHMQRGMHGMSVRIV